MSNWLNEQLSDQLSGLLPAGCPALRTVSGRHLITVCGLLALLAGCASPEPVVPPSPLTPITQPVGSNTVWSLKVGKKDKRGLTRFTPLLLDETIYAASIDGQVVAVEAGTGVLRWRRKLKRALASGVSGDADNVYVSDRDGTIIALAREDGKPRWESTMSSEVLAPVAAGFGAVVVRSADGRIAGLDASDGTERWSNTYTPPALTVHGYGKPSLLGNGVLLGLDEGKVVALSLDAGRVLWEAVVSYPVGRSEVERLVDVDADVLVDSSHIYAANYQGALVKLEPVRGRTLWSSPLSTTAGFAQTDEQLFVTDASDQVLALEKNKGETQWTQDALRGRELTRPVVLGKRVLVADLEGYVHLLSSDDGSLQGRFRVGDEPILELLVESDQETPEVLYLQSADGRLRAIRLGS